MSAGEHNQAYDFIVVGGGTSGCILAARLSENRDCRVLLAEAGNDFGMDAKPGQLRDPRLPVTEGYNWPFDANVRSNATPARLNEELRRAAKVFEVAARRVASLQGSLDNVREGGSVGTQFPYPVARVMGGGSTINGALALQPARADFAAWVQLGNDQWRWADVERYFHRLLRGDGACVPPLSIEAVHERDLSLMQRSFLDACSSLGFPAVDLFDGDRAGAGSVPKNVLDARRHSADEMYLAPARHRGNLTILADCLVDKLVLRKDGDDVCATAVQAWHQGQAQRYGARNVVMCAGAINSPLILMRSGIGSSQALKALDIPLFLSLAGVGENLIDHPAVCLWAVPKEGMCRSGEAIHQALLRVRSPSSAVNDMHFLMMSGVATRQFASLHTISGEETAVAISVMLGTPGSRGRVRLASSNPTAKPAITLNCLSDAADMRVMKYGVQLGWRLLNAPVLAEKLRQHVLWNASVLADDRQLQDMIASTVRGSLHPAGTLRMGAASDPLAVTDQLGRVHGCRNITIADASLMPAIPSVPINVACMAISERLAAHLGS